MCSGDGNPAESPRPVNDFLAEEYKALRGEIKSLVAENQTLERYAGGAVAAVITWLLTVKGVPDTAWKFACAVPFLIVALAALRCYGIGIRLSQIGAYIRTYEAWLMQGGSNAEKPPPRGWETNLHSPNATGGKNEGLPTGNGKTSWSLKEAPFHMTAYFYWVILLVATLAFLILAFLGCLSDQNQTKQATVTVSDPSGSSSTVTVPLGFTIEVKRPAN